MAIGGWFLAALCAGMLGWLGRPILVLLPESPDAQPEKPSYLTVSRAPHLDWWLAAAAITLVTIAALALPVYLMPAWLLLCGIGTWLAYIDWRTHLLPTRIVGPLCVATLSAVALEAWLAGSVWVLLRAVAVGGVAYGVFWMLWWVAERRRPGSFGFGDVRFSAPLALGLGSVGIWTAVTGLYLGFVVGAVAGVALKVRGYRGGFAFGPAMLVGAVLGLVLT